MQQASTDAELQKLAANARLRELRIEGGVTEAGLRFLRGLYRLDRLDVIRATIAGDGLTHLERMRELRRLTLFDCALSDEALARLPLLPGLAMLNLNTSRVTDAAVATLPRQPKLAELELGQSHVEGPGLAAFSQSKRLRSLSLYQSRITDDGLAHAAAIPSLERLDLGWTAIGDDGLAHLAQLPSLNWLRLESTKVTDAGISRLARCRALRWVGLDHTAVTMAGLSALKAALPECAISARDTAASKTDDGPLELIERPERRAAAPVADSWRRIDAWLAAHAPEILGSLRPPADEAALCRVEKTIGRKLPDDVRESYRIHDGQDCWTEDDVWIPGVFFGMPLSPLIEGEGVDWVWKHRTANVPEWFDENHPEAAEHRSHPPGAIRRAVMRAGWIPLYWDSGRSFFGIDLDPGPNGVAGQVIPFSYDLAGVGVDDKYVVAESWAHFLEDVADEMEAGRAVVAPREFGENWHRLRGAPEGWFWAAIPAWSKAKLPRTSG